MLKITRGVQDIRVFNAVTGMTYAEFTAILPSFDAALKQAKRTDRDLRQRQEGGGRKQTLRTGREKLFLIVFSVTCDATCDVLAWLFDVNRAQTHRWVGAFRPL